jgi:dihydrofolate reductase
MNITLIALMANNGVIGSEGNKPMFNAEHAKFLKEYVKGKPVVMGRKTFEALGGPIDGVAQTFVFSRQPGSFAEGIPTVLSIDGFFISAFDRMKAHEAVVIGGASTFHAFYPWADTMHITHLRDNVQGDRYFPQFPGWRPGLINARYEQGETQFERIDYRRDSYDPYPATTVEDLNTASILNHIRKLRGYRAKPMQLNEE